MKRVLFLLIFLLGMSGCGKIVDESAEINEEHDYRPTAGIILDDKNNNSKNDDVDNNIQDDLFAETVKRAYAVNYVKIEVSDEISGADNIYCGYCDEESFLISVGARNGNIGSGPMFYTTDFWICDYEGCGEAYPVETNSDIVSAIPYGDGILYSEYVSNKSGVYNWNLWKNDGFSLTLLDSGVGRVYDDDPLLFVVDNLPYYIWINGSDWGKNEYGVSRIVNGAVEQVFKDTAKLPWGIGVCTNGIEYCYLKEGEDCQTIVVCNSEGVLFEHEVTDNLCDYQITEKYLLYTACGEQTNKGVVVMINLETHNEEQFEHSYGPLYRIKGKGNQLLCVDNSWTPAIIDIDTKMVTKITHPLEGTSLKNSPIRFYSIGNSEYLCIVDTSKEYLFYRLNIGIN